MNQKLQHEHAPMQRAMNDLAAFYGTEHREFGLSEHKRELDAHDTRLESYWEWVVHQIEAANGTVEADIQKARNTVWVNVRQIVDEVTDEEDDNAQGLYAVHLSDEDKQLPLTKQASIALDCFAAHQGIETLDDFEITAVDGGGHEIQQDPDHEDNSCGDNADVEKYSDTPLAVRPKG